MVIGHRIDLAKINKSNKLNIFNPNLINFALTIYK